MAIICRKHKIVYIQVPGTGCTIVGEVLCDQFSGALLGRKHNDINELLGSGLLSNSELDEYLIVANVRNPYDRFVTEYQRYTGPWLEDYLSWVRQKLQHDKEQGTLTSKEYEKQLQHHRRQEFKTRLWAKILKRTPFGIWILYRVLKWQVQYRKNDLTGLLHKNPEKPKDGPVRHDHLEHLFPMLTHVDVALRQEQLEESLHSLLHAIGLDISINLPRVNTTKGKDIFSSYFSNWTRGLIESVYHRELSTFGYEFDHIVDDGLFVPLSETFQRKIDSLSNS